MIQVTRIAQVTRRTEVMKQEDNNDDNAGTVDNLFEELLSE